MCREKGREREQLVRFPFACVGKAWYLQGIAANRLSVDAPVRAAEIYAAIRVL